MFGHFSLGAHSRSLVPDDENGRVCPEDDSTQTQYRRSCHTPDCTADDIFERGRQVELRREVTASMDVLTHKFSNSHLRLEHGILPPLSCYSSVTSFGQPTEPTLEMDPCCRASSSDVPDRQATTLPTASTRESNSTRHSLNPKQDVRQLRRQPSSRFLNEAEANSTIQTRVEEMISTGTQCNVYTPPLVPVVPIEVDDNDGIDCEMGAAGLEVDEGVGGDDGPDIELIDRLLSLRRASGTLGIRKSGFPLYRSSTDTALRCQNLVRNKPRMRRRKVRQKPSLSTMSAEESQR